MMQYYNMPQKELQSLIDKIGQKNENYANILRMLHQVKGDREVSKIERSEPPID